MQAKPTPAATGKRDRRLLEKTGTPGVYKRGGGYVVVFRTLDGRQAKRCARTLAEARSLKASLTTDVRRGEYVEQRRVSFLDYATTWIASYNGRTARGVRPATLRDYRRALGLDGDGKPSGCGAVAHFGRMPLASIRPQDVKAYAAKLAESGKARNTIRLALAPVKAMLATAYEEGVIRTNPSAGLRLGRVVANASVKETRALTEDEVVRVLAEISEPYREVVEFLAQTGLRISELLPLTKADVDFGKSQVGITRRLSEGTIDMPKSRHGIRRVPLSPVVSRRLWTRLARQPDDALLFPATDGGPLDRSRLYEVVRAAGERAGIEWSVGLHTLRHTAATILYRRGVHKEAIRKMLGHHSWEFTSSTYLHLDDDDLPDGMVLGDLVANGVLTPRPLGDEAIVAAS